MLRKFLLQSGPNFDSGIFYFKIGRAELKK